MREYPVRVCESLRVRFPHSTRLIVSFEDENDCMEFKVLLKARLSQFELKINDSKTRVTKLGPPKVGGRDGNRRRHVSLIGFKIFLAKMRSGNRAKIVYKTNGKKISQSLTLIKERLWKMMHLPVELQGRYLNSVLRGHFNYFGMPGNGSSLARFRSMVIALWRRMLSRRSQVSKVSWIEMDELQTRLKIVPLKIKIPYGMLSSLVIV
jgi:RNA-directed DNA polymerase